MGGGVVYGSAFLAEVVKRRKWQTDRWEQNVLWSLYGGVSLPLFLLLAHTC